MENSQKIQIVNCSGASNTVEYADRIARLLDKNGEANIIHLNTTDFGIVKGKTPVTDEKITEIIKHIKNMA
jgi:uncharacterized metal-binding protein